MVAPSARSLRSPRAPRRPRTTAVCGLLAAGALSLAVAAAQPAAATPLTFEAILGQYNLVVLGSSTSTSNVHGRAFIGGSLAGGDYVQHVPAGGDAAYDDLVVGGSISGNINVNNGGDVTVGGSGSGALNLNGGSVGSQTATFGGSYVGTFNQGTKIEGAMVAIPDFGSVATTASAALAALSGNAAGVSGNRAVFDRAPDANGLSVYDIADGATFFDAVGEVELALNGADTVIVNVGGTSLALADNFLGGPFAAAAHVIWNFYEATDLTLSTQFFGSVLAPLAHVTNGNSIEGTLVAGSLTQHGELHLAPFAGDLPETGGGGTALVPEAGTLGLAGLGLLGLGLVGAAAAGPRRRTAA